MAGEFQKLRGTQGEIIWKCVHCGIDIACDTKPRGHICNLEEDNANEAAEVIPMTNPQAPFVRAPTQGPDRFVTLPGPANFGQTRSH